MITQPYRKEEQPAGVGQDGADAPRDDWLEAKPARQHHRFPLEWIEGSGAVKVAVVKGLGVRKQVGLRRQWRPRQLVWTIAVVAWLSGVVTGAVGGGAVALMHCAAKAEGLRAEQMALTAGYRALLFSPRPVAR